MSNKDFKVKNGLTVTESLSVGAGANVVGLSASSTRNGFVSAGRDLADIFGGSGSGTIEGVTAGSGLSGGGTSGTVTLTVGRGDGVTITDNTVAVDSTVVRTSGNQTIAGCKTFSDNTTITGNLSVTGDITCIDTVFSVTSALSVVNEGTGPALVVQQNGSEPIAHFIDKNGDDIFFNDNGTIQTPYLSSGRNTCFGNCVGIGSAAPGEKLTVNISASGDLKGSCLDINGSGNISTTLTVGGNLDISDTIYHTGDSNTKIRFPDVDTISFHTSGDEQMKIDSAGNITVSGNISANGHLTTESLNVSSTNNGILSAGRDLADIFATTSGNVDGSGTVNKLPVWTDSDTLGDSPLSSTGVCVNLQDDGKMLFGNNNDLKIYHNGSNSIIEDSGTGGLFLLADAATYIQTPTGESKAKFTKDAGVELFYDDSKKFETTNTGVDITGALSANGNITG